MKYCPKCGKELFDEAVVCPGCGCAQGKTPVSTQSDASSFGYCLLGFCVPVAGLVLWLVWRDSTPLRAKSAGKGALICAIACVAFYIFYIILIMVAAVTGAI